MITKFKGRKVIKNWVLLPLYKILNSCIAFFCSQFLSLSSEVTIGFDATAYTFTETDSTVSRSVSVSVRSGSLARNVVVTVQTMDGTAIGRILVNTHTL